MSLSRESYQNVYSIQENISALFRHFKHYGPVHSMNLHLYGSRVFGLDTPTSNLNIFLDINDSYRKVLKPEEALQQTYLYAGMFDRSSEWNLTRPLKKYMTGYYVYEDYLCSVPCITAEHLNTGITCVIMFTGGYIVEHSKFTAFLYDLQPHAREVSRQLMTWFDVHFESHIKSVTQILILFYFQVKRFMPSTVDVQANCIGENLYPVLEYYQEKNEKKQFYEEVNVAFDKNLKQKDLGLSSMNNNIYQHMIGFFQFYLTFDFGVYAVNAKYGTMFQKSNLHDPVQIYGLMLSKNVGKLYSDMWVARLKKFCDDCIMKLHKK